MNIEYSIYLYYITEVVRSKLAFVINRLDLMLDRLMIEHQVFDLLRQPVEVEFVTRIHNDRNEEARFVVICHWSLIPFVCFEV